MRVWLFFPAALNWLGTPLGFYRASKEIYQSGGWRGLFQGHSVTLVRIFPYAAIKFLAFERYKQVLEAKYQRPLSKTSHFIAGSLAGVTSLVLTYPCELVRVRLAYETQQSHPPRLSSMIRAIYSEPVTPAFGGILKLTNFYKGFVPSILGIIPYAGTSFAAHAYLTRVCRTALAPWAVVPNANSGPTKELRAWAELSCGALAGALGQTVSYPLEVIRRRLQVAGATHTKFTIFSASSAIFRDQGWRGFYVGLSIGYLKVAPMVGISFYVYDRMKRMLHVN